MTVPLLRLNKVTKSFAAVRALSEVSFEVFPGEVHALVGENGAGKSTLVRIITGATEPDHGSIEIHGQSMRGLSPARARQLGIACVYQHPALFPDLSVAENLELRLESSAPFRGIAWRALRDKAQAILREIGATISPDSLVRNLSMPEQQLVEIACAVGANARIVVFDEPTASLTTREQHLLFAIIRKLRQGGAGIVYVSHRLEEIFTLTDRVTVLRDGQQVRTCPTSELDEARLIRLMVGRELVQREARQDSTRTETVLSVRDLGCPASGVQSVSFDIRGGEVFGLAGLVGAGRTELARTLFGLTPADRGEIYFGGEKVQVRSPAGAKALGIAYVPEDRVQHGVVLELPIDQNISLASYNRLFPNGWLNGQKELELAADYIRKLDIRAPGPEAPVSALSGGNQQKVALARWLATRPKQLILDEPTQGVDVGAKKEIHKLIDSLAAGGMAVLLISSDLPELLALSNRIGVMRSGRLVAVMPGHCEPHEVMAAAFGQERET
jgi:rhamnose transport system ATP-binding protein